MAPTTKGRASAPAESNASADPGQADEQTLHHIEALIEARTASAPEPEYPSALAAKTAAVMSEVARVKKSGFNDAQKYAFAQEGDIADMVRVLLAKYRVAMHGSIISVERIGITSRNGNSGTEARVRMQFTLTCADTGEVEESYWEGDATDYQDKAVPKAITACKKSWLIFRFLISTGDLAEADAAGEEFTRGGYQQPTQQSAQARSQQSGPDSRKVTTGQVSRLFALSRNVPFLYRDGQVDKPALHDLARWVLRKDDAPNPVASLNDLTRDEVQRVFVVLERCADPEQAGAVFAAVDEWTNAMGSGEAPAPDAAGGADDLPDEDPGEGYPG